MTKAEIEERKSTEVKVDLVEVKIPNYLTAKQKQEYENYANKLKHVKILTELDEEALARYVVTADEYLKIDKLLQKELKKKEINIDSINAIQLLHNRALSQIRALASDLGLTPTSRAKLVIPKEPEKIKDNKFSKFANNGQVR